jgi:hypothetical protein
MAKSYRVGDVIYFERIRVKVVDITVHPVNDEGITIESLKPIIRKGVNWGIRRWVLAREQLEAGE